MVAAVGDAADITEIEVFTSESLDEDREEPAPRLDTEWGAPAGGKAAPRLDTGGGGAAPHVESGCVAPEGLAREAGPHSYGPS
jgi:hypothetical protein